MELVTRQVMYERGRATFREMLAEGLEDLIPNCPAFRIFPEFMAGYMSAYLAYKEAMR